MVKKRTVWHRIGSFMDAYKRRFGIKAEIRGEWIQRQRELIETLLISADRTEDTHDFLCELLLPRTNWHFENDAYRGLGIHLHHIRERILNATVENGCFKKEIPFSRKLMTLCNLAIRAKRLMAEVEFGRHSPQRRRVKGLLRVRMETGIFRDRDTRWIEEFINKKIKV